MVTEPISHSPCLLSYQVGGSFLPTQLDLSVQSSFMIVTDYHQILYDNELDVFRAIAEGEEKTYFSLKTQAASGNSESSSPEICGPDCGRFPYKTQWELLI